MPIYEFRCQGCGCAFELLALTSGEEAGAKCPKCGGREISRLISSCASLVSSGGGGQTGPSVQNRSCGKESSCATITLPGHSRD